MVQSPLPPLPWYHRRGWAIALLLLFPPLGIVLLWWGQHLHRNLRIWLSAGFALLFLGFLGAAISGEQPRMRAGAPSQLVTESGSETEVPPYEIADDVDLAPKSGHQILVNVRNPDLTNAQCSSIIARLRPRAGREGQVAVRIPLHNTRASEQTRFFPLCYDNLDGSGVQEGTARQMQRAFDNKPAGQDR